MAQKLLTDETGQLILQAIKELDTVALNKIGDLTDLNTSNKASLVAAINELLTQRGEIAALNTLTSILTYDGAGAHNALHRGKNLGNALTSAQISAISAGTFQDMYIGDFWEFPNIPYTYLDENGEQKSSTYSGRMLIADCDYFFNSGALNNGFPKTVKHHILVVPERTLYSDVIYNDTNTTEGGYVGSKMRTVYLRRAEAIFNACFGENHILTYSDRLVNAVTNGVPSAKIWCDTRVELLTQAMTFGIAPFNSVSNQLSISSKQLSLFRYRPSLLHRSWFWLRDVASSTEFAFVNGEGELSKFPATTAGGNIRPFVLVY